MNAGSTHISMVSFQARIACQRGSVAPAGPAQAKHLIAFVVLSQLAMWQSFIPIFKQKENHKLLDPTQFLLYGI